MPTSASKIGSAVCVAVALAIAAPAAGQPRNVARAKQEYKLGYKYLQASNFKRALVHYKRSYELVARPRTLFNIAVCHEKLNQLKLALRHYRDFIQLAQGRDRQFKAQARQKVTMLEYKLTAVVTVMSRPPGARIYVDGSDRARGRTPLRLKLMAGNHKLRATVPGAVQVRHIEVRGRQELRVRFSLTPTAEVLIQVEPRDAMIRRSGERTTAKGTFRRKLALGKHQFVVRRKGYHPERVDVFVKPGHIHERVVRLRPRRDKALLLVKTSTAGAQVSVNGLVVGTTSLLTAPTGGRARLRYAVKAGNHLVSVETGGASWQRRVHLTPGERLSVDVSFGGSSSAKKWGLAALGTISVAVGGFLGVSALKDVRSDMQSDHDRGKDRALISDVLLVGGAAALLTSWYFSKKNKPKARVERSHEKP